MTTPPWFPVVYERRRHSEGFGGKSRRRTQHCGLAPGRIASRHRFGRGRARDSYGENPEGNQGGNQHKVPAQVPMRVGAWPGKISPNIRSCPKFVNTVASIYCEDIATAVGHGLQR